MKYAILIQRGNEMNTLFRTLDSIYQKRLNDGQTIYDMVDEMVESTSEECFNSWYEARMYKIIKDEDKKL